MADQLKITSKTAIQPLCNCSSNSDLKLVDPSHLCHCCSSLKDCVLSNQISEENSFEHIFGLNNDFFYIIEQIENEKVINYERGVAFVYSKDGHTYLNRKYSFFVGKNVTEAFPNRTNVPFPFKCYDEHSNIVCYSTIPHSYQECLAVDNGVICSSSPLLPHVVSLQEDSLLGRFDDIVTSISFTDNRLVDKIGHLISKFSKQLKLKTTKLSVKRIEAETVDLLASSNVKAKKGSLYYDESDDTIKVYNGSEWKTVAFVKE